MKAKNQPAPNEEAQPDLDSRLVNYPAFLGWEDAKKSRSKAGNQMKTDHGIRGG